MFTVDDQGLPLAPEVNDDNTAVRDNFKNQYLHNNAVMAGGFFLACDFFFFDFPLLK